MDQERWEKLKQIFGDALELQPAEREPFVRNAAKDDPDLLSELLRFLAENDRESELLSRPALVGARTPSPDEKPRFEASTVLARRFRIVRFIARGGMGEVYEAEDLELGERVALKAIRQRVAPDTDLRAMFKREVQLARRVTHPNVCRIFDLAQHEDTENGTSTILLSMELVEGQTLAEHLRQRGPMPFRDAMPLIEDIAAGLQAVHDAGIIHGDLKPGNVMLVSRSGETSLRALVMDFGMALPVAQEAAAALSSPAPHLPTSAQTIEGDSQAPTLAPPGWILHGGTPDYFAPEQAAGGPATTATDVYAFALVIADMLGVPRPIRMKPEAERMPSQWARVLCRSLDADPVRRYTGPAELAGALRTSMNRRPRTAAIAAGIALGAIAIAGGVYWGSGVETGGKIQRLLLTEGALTIRSPSPDGRYLAATSWDTGDLVLLNPGNSKVRRLTHKSSSWDEHPGGLIDARFSPDGLQIAYAWGIDRQQSDLRIIGADGSGERVLYKDPNSAPSIVDWSPDGKRILLQLQPRQGVARLASLHLQDGSLQFLEKEPNGQLFGQARFGADSSSVIFDARTASNGGREIRRLTWTGEESTLVGRTGSNSIIGWSPDRSRLIFSSDRRGHDGIWSIGVSAAGAEAEPKELVSETRGWDPIGISRAGSLFYRQESNTVDVFTAVLDLVTGRTVSPPQRVMDRFAQGYDYPSWSEDGRFLVFDSKDHSAGAAMVIYDRERATASEVRLDLRLAMRPQWWGHGVAIMVRGVGNDNVTGIYRVDPQTGRAHLQFKASDLESNYEGVWSRDGKIHFNRYGQVYRGLFRLNTETGERRILYTPTPGIDLGTENLALSPDGRTLAFHARNDAAGTGTLMLVPTEGGESRPLLTIHRPESFWYGSFTWTPDGQRILAVRSRPTGPPGHEPISELWQVPVDGSPPTRIEFPGLFVQTLRMNRDGRTIAFTVRHWKSEIWVLQNFL